MDRFKDLRSEETGAEVADKPADGVDGEYIKSIVDAEKEFDLSTVIACSAGSNAVDDSRPSRNVSGSRRDSHETCNDTRAESNSRPFFLKSVIQQTPSDTTHRSSEISNNSRHNSTHTRAQGRASVEAKPPYPQEYSPNDDLGDVMRTEVQLMCTMTPPLPKHE